VQATLRETALALGADYFGVSDLAPAREFVLEQGGAMVSPYPRAIAVGARMPSDIVDQLSHHTDRVVGLVYRSHGYVLNRRLDELVSRLTSLLQREGHGAFPIPASLTVDEDGHRGQFSHKLAAHLAGLGWIGKSCLLVTPDVGPRVRWASILTDAPLVPGEPVAEGCGECQACVDACPAQAFTGKSFRVDEPREARFDVARCYEYQRGVEGQLCGVCVYVCPMGRKAGTG
jgi:epoxyqueuosine reductase QueG